MDSISKKGREKEGKEKEKDGRKEGRKGEPNPHSNSERKIQITKKIKKLLKLYFILLKKINEEAPPRP